MDTLDVFNRVVSGSFVPPEVHKRDISEPHRQAILGCLSKDIAQRIPDCATLRKVLSGEQQWNCAPPTSETVDFGSDDTMDFEEPHSSKSTPLSMMSSASPNTNESRSNVWHLRAPLTFGVLLVLLWVGLPDPDNDEDIELSPSTSEVPPPNNASTATRSKDGKPDEHPGLDLEVKDTDPTQTINQSASSRPTASSTVQCC